MSICIRIYIYIYLIYSSRASRERKFQKKKTMNQRKNFPIECAPGDQPARCPHRVFCVNEPSAVPSGGGVLVVGVLCFRGVSVVAM